MLILKYDFKLISKDNEKIIGKYSKRYFLSKKFKDWENTVKFMTKQQYDGKPLEGNLAVRLIVAFENKIHADTTNLFKGVCDALQGIVYVNDRQIKSAEIIIFERETKNHFIVSVETL